MLVDWVGVIGVGGSVGVRQTPGGGVLVSRCQHVLIFDHVYWYGITVRGL